MSKKKGRKLKKRKNEKSEIKQERMKERMIERKERKPLWTWHVAICILCPNFRIFQNMYKTEKEKKIV